MEMRNKNEEMLNELEENDKNNRELYELLKSIADRREERRRKWIKTKKF